MSESKLLELAEDLTPYDLPIGVYLVTMDGRFLRYNEKVRRIFDFAPEPNRAVSIKDYYSNPDLREQFKREAEKREQIGENSEKILPMHINGDEVFLQDFAKAIRDPKTNELLGYICCVTDVTEEERYKRLFDHLPAGIYQLDDEDHLVNANTAFVKLHGSDSLDDIKGRPINEFYADPERADLFRRLIDEEGEIVNKKVELRKKSGEIFDACVSAFRLVKNQEYAGREGTVIDISTETRYQKILQKVPVGLYSLVLQDYEIKEIKDCNKQFAEILGFKSVEHATEADPAILKSFSEKYSDLLKDLTDKAELKRPLRKRIKIKNLKDKELVCQVNCLALPDYHNTRSINCVGAIQDITNEAELQKKITELTEDIGQTLHSYTATLVMTRQSIEPVIKFLSHDLPKSEVTETEFEARKFLPALDKSIKTLTPNLKKLKELGDSTERVAALSEHKWQRLAELTDVLETYEEAIPIAELRFPSVRDTALEILAVYKRIGKGIFPKELMRQIQVDLDHILRICGFVALTQVNDRILEMDHRVGMLREYITSDARIEEKMEIRAVSELVREAIKNLEEYAKNRGITIRANLDSRIKVLVRDREIVRAISNILHNALKYSWKRSDDSPPWVSVIIESCDQLVKIMVENWGVPIPREEIDKGLVFKLGYRGRLSGDRGRIGTGIGLTDTKRVAASHGGGVSLESHPASPYGKKDDYTKPFITRVTLSLPVRMTKKES